MNPTYTDILTSIGNQLKLRKKYLFLRTFMIVWPFLLLAGSMLVARRFYTEDTLRDMFVTFPYVFYIWGYVIAAAVYSAVVSFIFNIEKRIWIDSFFDKRDLTPAQSWNIAKRLFWPAVGFRIRLFIRYYLFPFALLLIVIAGSCVFMVKNEYIFLTPIGIVVGSLIAYAIYTYYLNLRLRFSWFVFLDSYTGQSKEIDIIFQDMEKLHAITTGDNFVKAIVVDLGAASIEAVINTAVGLVSLATNMTTGGSSRGILGIIQIFTKELARQIRSYAQIAGFYLLYMVARKELHGQEQHVNEYVYGLGDGK